MGKKRQYKDDYTGDVKSIRQHHKKLRVLVGALCVTGIIAAGGATYVLMNPAQTMTKEGIDEMDPNEDFIVTDDDVVQADAFFEDFEDDEQSYVQEENYDDVPLIEEVDNKKKKPADAIPAEDEEETEDAYDADDAVLAGGMIEDAVIADEEDAGEVASTEAAMAETQSEAVEEAAAEIQSEAVEEAVEEIQSEAIEEPAAEIVGVSETEASETLATEAPAAEEEAVLDETEANVAETEAASDETEVASETEAAETEAVEAKAVETETPETEEAQSETELLESETQGSEIREKTKDEVYVETEGELLDEKWIDSVGLEIKTENGWNTAETESGAIEVDADQTLRFRVTYTVQPGTLSQEMRTLIYQIPKEVTSVDESYGEIVDKDEKVIADYAIDNTGVICVTFTEEIAELNAEGAKVTCKIEFKTQASNLVQ